MILSFSDDEEDIYTEKAVLTGTDSGIANIKEDCIDSGNRKPAGIIERIEKAFSEWAKMIGMIIEYADRATPIGGRPGI